MTYPDQLPSTPDRSQIWETFDWAYQTVATQPHTLWYETGARYLRSSTTVPDITFYHLREIQDAHGKLHAPSYDPTYTEPGIYHWQKWNVRSPQQITPYMKTTSQKEVAQHRIRYPEEGFMATSTIPGLVTTFVRLAAYPQEVDRVANKLVDFAIDTPKFEGQSRLSFSTAVFTIIAQRVKVGRSPGSSEESTNDPPSTVDAFLRVQDSTHGKDTVANAGRAFTKLLLSNACGAFSADDVSLLYQESITEAVREFDEAGLIAPAFWLDTGIGSKAGTKNTSFLKLLHNRLTGPDRQAILKTQSATAKRDLLGYYIGAMLTVFQTEEHRSQNTARLLQNIQHQGARPNFPRVDLTKLMRQAHAIAQSLSTPKSDQPAAKPLPPELADTHSVGDALMRVTYLTRSPQAPRNTKLDMLANDTMQAEIASMMAGEGMWRNTKRTMGYVALALPETSPARLDEVQDRLNEGQSPVTALRSLQTD